MLLWANLLYEERDGRTLLHAMPVLIAALGILAIAYRYYSAFLAARVAVLDDSVTTPAHRLNDGQNYHPTNRWVLFGHHFAAISGAGPLIGPVLAIQYGFAPGLVWLIVGVCLAGAVQDMLVLAASVRRDGKSLAEIARKDLGPWAHLVVSAAILFIVIIALAGLGIIVVKALGGEEAQIKPGALIKLPERALPEVESEHSDARTTALRMPKGCAMKHTPQHHWSQRPESFLLLVPREKPFDATTDLTLLIEDGKTHMVFTAPANTRLLILGSSWGTFTIACTIPIALFVGLYMYRIRKGHVVEASLLGAVGVIAATIVGSLIPGSALESWFQLSREQTIVAMMVYGFVASVLPVWLLLCPRDYLSSFLKIGTILLLIVGVCVANPTLEAMPLNPEFQDGGPTFEGQIFPFVFICIMCGAISGFHSLVSSGTTPKMIGKESDIRFIGYGSMLMEGLVGIVALIAAAALPNRLYFEMNTDHQKEAKYQKQLDKLYRTVKEMPEASDPMHQVRMPRHDIAEVETMIGGESLRGRTGGAVTLAVGMALIFTDALSWTGWAVEGIMKYWFHFAIMFEALFILTTIDTGTRIARFLLQEALGKFHPKFEQTDWMPGAALATAIVTLGWGALIWTGSVGTIWPMFGIANQLLAVIALALVTQMLVTTGRVRYVWVTILPICFVIATTMTAGAQLLWSGFPQLIKDGKVLSGWLSIAFTLFVMACVMTLLLIVAARCVAWLQGERRRRARV